MHPLQSCRSPSLCDDSGNRLTATGFGFTRTKVYDALNRVTSVTMDYGSFSKEVQYTYDEVSNRKIMTYPEGQTVTYTYDALNRLTKLQDSVAGAWNFTYDAGSRRTRLVYPSGLKTEYAFYAANWLKGVYTNTSGGSVVQSFVYTYDKAGNRKTVTENGGNVSTYAYDDAYRLVSESYTGGLTINYTYDDSGNRLTERRNGVQTNYTYDADNRLASKGTATYSYDDNGNLIQKNDGGQMTNYTWDYENRLTGVSLPGGASISYEYTTDGKMLSRTESGVKTWYAYDFAEVNGFDDMMAEYNATGVLQARYIHGPGIDEPLAVIQGGTTRYYLRDALGSVMGLAAGQTLSSVYHYEAFGESRAWSGTIEEFGFTSRVLDPSSDLYFYRARWYDIEAGRFMSKNPMRLVEPTDSYHYAKNNPANLDDPSGLPGRPIPNGGGRTCRPGCHYDTAKQECVSDINGVLCQCETWIRDEINTLSLWSFSQLSLWTNQLNCLYFIFGRGYRRLQVLTEPFHTSNDKFTHAWVSCALARYCRLPYAIVMVAGILYEQHTGFYGDWKKDVVADHIGSSTCANNNQLSCCICAASYYGWP